ncbi:MAG: hypothetical protein WD939_02510 [Dehalococcoidia bacterium]
MRKQSLLLIATLLLSAAFAIGAIACGDDDDDGDGNGAVATATTAPDGGDATATTAPDDGNGEPSAATVIATDNADLGTILTTTDGYTLYTFNNDSEGVSTCADACAQTWPPLLIPSGEPTAGEGVSGELATITRDDGGTQVTYDGLPLYYYSADPAPGDANGQAFGDLWFVVELG